MEWVVHIGTQKTGSKALQGFCVRERERVAGATICYPETGRQGVWHEPVYYDLEAGRRDLLEGARDEALSSGADLAILSCEGFHDLPLRCLEAIRDTLGGARIVLFMRRQDAFLSSWYNQMIKAHRVGISDIVAFERHLLEPHPWADYRSILEKWGSVFGWDALHPLVYEKGTDSVTQFFGALGLEVDVVGLDRTNPNRALDAGTASLLRALKEIAGDTEDLPELVRRVHQRFRRAFVDTYAAHEPTHFDLATRRRLMAIYAEGNERVRERFFPQRPALFGDLDDAVHQPLDLAAGRRAARAFLAEPPSPSPAPRMPRALDA